MSSSVGFTFGELGSVRDQQTTIVDCRADAIRDVPHLNIHDDGAPPRVGEYAIDYSPLSPSDLVDAERDAELEALLAASVVVRRSAGP